MNLNRLSVRRLAERIRQGKIDPFDLITRRLEAVKRHNPVLNALVHTDESSVMKTARALSREARHGRFRGRLHGIPFSAKDNLCVKGMPGSDGSKSSFYQSASENSPVVKKALAAGACCIGKGNMPEYGKSTAFTDNRLYGKTSNPFNLDYSPGGSTGGDAAALAAGMCDFALGGDSGGSLRVPAGFCGLFALMPTRGLVTNGRGRFTASTFTKMFGAPGVLAKTIDDIELLLDVLTGYNRHDPYSSPPLSPFGTGSHRISNRFAYFSELAGTKCCSEIESSLISVVSSFESIGFTGERRCPEPFERSFEPFIILAGQASLKQEDIIYDNMSNPRNLNEESWIVTTLRKRLDRHLPPLTTEKVLLSLYLVEELRFEILKFFDDYDFIVCPTAAVSSVKCGEKSFMVDSKEVLSPYVFHFSRAVNLLGLPAIAFPTGLSSQKLPLGLQIVGPRFSEKTLVKILRDAGFREKLVSPMCTE